MTNTATFSPSAASDTRRKATAALLAFFVTAPVVFLPLAAPRTAQAQIPNAIKNMSTGKKVVAVAGLALLYYLYRKHQAKVAQQAETANTPNMAPGGTSAGGTTTAAARRPQLYRSKNGGVYYREGTKAVWLTVPRQAVQVSQEELAQYAPDYKQYQGQRAPARPSRNYRTQSFSDFDPDVMSGTSGGSMAPSGPRGAR